MLFQKKSSHCGWGLSAAGQKDVRGVLIFSLHTYYILSAYLVSYIYECCYLRINSA